MTSQPGDNGQLKLALAFVLGLGVAGGGAWLASGGGEKASAKTGARIAVEAPAVEASPISTAEARDEAPTPSGCSACRNFRLRGCSPS